MILFHLQDKWYKSGHYSSRHSLCYRFSLHCDLVLDFDQRTIVKSRHGHTMFPTDVVELAKFKLWVLGKTFDDLPEINGEAIDKCLYK